MRASRCSLVATLPVRACAQTALTTHNMHIFAIKRQVSKQPLNIQTCAVHCSWSQSLAKQHIACKDNTNFVTAAKCLTQWC